MFFSTFAKQEASVRCELRSGGGRWQETESWTTCEKTVTSDRARWRAQVAVSKPGTWRISVYQHKGGLLWDKHSLYLHAKKWVSAPSWLAPNRDVADIIPIAPVEARTRVSGAGLIRLAMAKDRAKGLKATIAAPGKRDSWDGSECVQLSLPDDESRVEALILLKFAVIGSHTVKVWISDDDRVAGTLNFLGEYGFDVTAPADPTWSVVQFVPPGREILPLASTVMKVEPAAQGINAPSRHLLWTYDYKGEDFSVYVRGHEPGKTLFPNVLETKSLGGGWKRTKVSFNFPQAIGYSIHTAVDCRGQPTQWVNCGAMAVHDPDAESRLMAALSVRSRA
jgi:hypothetical protein